MQHCGIYDLQELGRITLKQYILMMKSVRARKLDEMENAHLQAWLNYRVQDTKTRGKKTVLLYKTFGSFFDRKKFETETQGKADDPATRDFKRLVAKANGGR